MRGIVGPEAVLAEIVVSTGIDAVARLPLRSGDPEPPRPEPPMPEPFPPPPPQPVPPQPEQPEPPPLPIPPGDPINPPDQLNSRAAARLSACPGW